MLDRLASSLAIPKNIAGDLSLILLFIGASLFVGFIFGRWKLVNILINVYIAVALVGVMPESWFVVSAYAKAGLFVVLLTALTMFDERLFDIHITSAGTDFFWRFFVTSFLVTGSVLSSIFSFLPKSVALSWVTPDLYFYIASPWALLFWLAVPIFALFFINTRLR
ncbi:MAG: hypothetical protein E6Q06_03860 [Candidatus Moraniibacteriota bacterium]|nr:MAG: hypothetical protein E6Q06_03860 [Candidatus Moranbacteria bacterium]